MLFISTMLRDGNLGGTFHSDGDCPGLYIHRADGIQIRTFAVVGRCRKSPLQNPLSSAFPNASIISFPNGFQYLVLFLQLVRQHAES